MTPQPTYVAIPPRVLQYGVNAPLPERMTLRAGPLTAEFENGDLRYIRHGDVELVRRIYVAVRDRNWDTVAPAITDLKVNAGVDQFEVSFDVEHKIRDVHFVWKGRVTGDAAGHIAYEMDGKAVSSFLKNRIGICVLHPAAAAGAAAVVEHEDGTVEHGAFPKLISPHQPFFDIKAITHEAAPGLRAKTAFEGETFEMEDQRNWTDASFKTYSTPLRKRFPQEIKAGEAVHHKVTLTIESVPQAAPAAPKSSPAITFAVGADRSPLPGIGLALPSHGRRLTAMEAVRVRALNLSHLRSDIDLTKPGWEMPLLVAHEQAHFAGTSLQLGLVVDDGAEAQLERVASFMAARNNLVPEWRVFWIFHSGEKVTASKWVEIAKVKLAKFAPKSRFGGGTRSYFTELNRNRPGAPLPDLITWSVNPQVHAFDNSSIIETLETQGDCLRSARSFLPEAKLCVGPVTLRPRFNPNATGPQAGPAPDELPPQVDPRQMSLLCGSWTAASVKYLAQAGASDLTYFETTGQLGVMEMEQPAALSEMFKSKPGGPYPAWHVLADIGEFSRGQVAHTKSSSPLAVDGIALQKDEGKLTVILGSFSSAPVKVAVTGLPDGVGVERRLLTANVEASMLAPEKYRQLPVGRRRYPVSGGRMEIELGPFGISRIDIGESSPVTPHPGAPGRASTSTSPAVNRLRAIITRTQQ